MESSLIVLFNVIFCQKNEIEKARGKNIDFPQLPADIPNLQDCIGISIPTISVFVHSPKQPIVTHNVHDFFLQEILYNPSGYRPSMSNMIRMLLIGFSPVHFQNIKSNLIR